VWILELITELLTIFLYNDTKYNRYNTDLKIIDMANCISKTMRLLDIEYAILIRYNNQTANTRA
jgi:hypothetical protein